MDQKQQKTKKKSQTAVSEGFRLRKGGVPPNRKGGKTAGKKTVKIRMQKGAHGRGTAYYKGSYKRKKKPEKESDRVDSMTLGDGYAILLRGNFGRRTEEGLDHSRVIKLKNLSPPASR